MGWTLSRVALVAALLVSVGFGASCALKSKRLVARDDQRIEARPPTPVEYPFRAVGSLRISSGAFASSGYLLVAKRGDAFRVEIYSSDGALFAAFGSENGRLYAIDPDGGGKSVFKLTPIVSIRVDDRKIALPVSILATLALGVEPRHERALPRSSIDGLDCLTAPRERIDICSRAGRVAMIIIDPDRRSRRMIVKLKTRSDQREPYVERFDIERPSERWRVEVVWNSLERADRFAPGFFSFDEPVDLFRDSANSYR